MNKNTPIQLIRIFLVLFVFIGGSYLNANSQQQTAYFSADINNNNIIPESHITMIEKYEDSDFISKDLLNHYLISLKSKISDDYLGITIVAFGDVMLDRAVRSLMDANGLTYPFEKMKLRELAETKNAHIIMANLEGPIRTIPVPTSKSISFRFKPDVIETLKYSGINLVSLANNHALDQGWQGRDETMKYLDETEIDYFGNPRDDLEEFVFFTEINDKNLAFIGFDDTIFKLDEEEVSTLISSINNKSDLVIISIHWGAEYEHKPLKRQVNLAHMFVDSGADVVIGHHPHVVQVMEIYNDSPIFYSLGNFVFDQYWSLDTQEGMGVNMTIRDKSIDIDLLPYSIPKSQPILMQGVEKQQFLEKFINWHEGFSENEWLTSDFKDEIQNGSIRINLTD